MNLKVAVVTGHHTYDVLNFHKLWNSMPGVDPFIQHLEDFSSSPDTVRDSYDCVVFYMMPIIELKDDMPWYWGKPKTALLHLGSSRQGIVILHHTVWAFEKWDFWSELIGMPDRKAGEQPTLQNINVKVANKEHPVTKGLSDWVIPDETYDMSEPGGDIRVLLELENPFCMKSGAWVRKHKNSNVFCTVLGHDNKSWSNENFRELLKRGVFWSAGK